jgi:hypothetical protein
MTRNDAEVLWQWDCDIPVCPTEPDQGCWICDCDPGSALLDPGESTEYAWDGIEFSEIDPPVGCDDCGSCLLAAPPPPGEYTLTVRFREACVDPDPLACDEDAPLQLASVKFDYPTDTVVLPIE